MGEKMLKILDLKFGTRNKTFFRNRLDGKYIYIYCANKLRLYFVCSYIMVKIVDGRI